MKRSHCLMRLLFAFRFFAILMLAAFSIVICSGPLSAVENPPVPEAEYWRVIAELYAAATVESETPSDDVIDVFDDLADDLASISVVELQNGSVMPLEHGVLLAELRADSPDIDLIQRQTSALLTAKKAQTAEIFDQADVTSLAPILARPEFRYQRPEPPRFVRWLLDRVERFLGWLARLLPDWNLEIPAVLVRALAVIAIIALAGAIAYVLAQIAGEFTAEVRPEHDDEGHGVPLTADAALNRAQELSTGGDYRSAVRYLYLSTLLLLEERGLFRYDRSLTNREYLNRVAHDPTLSITLQDVVDVFDRTWYGYQPLDEATYQRYANTVETLKRYR